MQRYIYGDLNKAGYRTVSSDNVFFTSNAKNLAKLMYYDIASKHGNLAPNGHKCFWMLTTDLQVLGGQDHLFIQESGMVPQRETTVVQGYRSDPEDGELYGPKFLELLSTAFISSDEALNVAETEELQKIEASALPSEDIQPAVLPRGLSEGVLLALLQGKRVIIRLSSTGAEAMAESRQYLKAIYQRLPYEMRRNNGCLTGATKPMLGISRAFKVVLMDGDADTAGIHSDEFQVFFDLTGGDIPEKTGTHLIKFLASETPETVDAFFAYCQETLKAGNVKSPGLAHYGDLLAVYTIGQKSIAGEDIRGWSVRLWDNTWIGEDLQKSIREKIAKAMSTEDLTDYMKAAAPAYGDLFQLGIMCRADKDKDKKAPRDQNAALTLRMMLRLPGYDTKKVGQALADHFVSKAKAQYPCLTEEKPTKATLAELETIQLPEKQENPSAWLDVLREDVRQELESLATRRKSTYAEQFSLQQTAGEERIAGWAPDGDLEEVYRDLNGHYLHEELTAGWNRLIAQKIVGVCLAFALPGELDEYRDLLEKERKLRECLNGHGGSFTPEQDSVLQGLTKKWSGILDLCNRKCTTAEELECWLLEADNAGMEPALALEQKQKKARGLLSVIPDGLTLKETKQWLKSCEKHKDLLSEARIFFEPWGVKGEAGLLLDQIKKLEQYRKENGTEPRLENEKIRLWIAGQFPENKDLMKLLIRKSPEKRKTLVKILAQKGEDITAADLKELYISGCSWKSLCEDVGEDFSESWRKAMNEFLPDLPALPEPLKSQPPRKDTGKQILLLIELVLFGLAGMMPAAIMLATGTGTLVSCAITAAGLVAFTAGFMGAAAAVKPKQRKRFLIGLGLALVPGILAAIAVLVLCLI